MLLLFAVVTLGKTIGVAATTLICVVCPDSLGEVLVVGAAMDDLATLLAPLAELVAEEVDKSAIGDEISFNGFSL